MDTLLLAARVVVSLVAVFGLMWLVQRKVRTGGAATRAKALSVVARQSVGQKASVVLVDTDGKRFMLGVTEHGISVLHTGEAPVVPEPVPSPVQSPVGSFLGWPVDASTDAPVDPTTDAPVDPTADAPVGLDDATDPQSTSQPTPLPTPLPTRREVRQASFQAELARQRAGLAPSAGAAPKGTGSILEPATWRLAADAIRAGRRS
ncbi:hypothetical protein GCM10023258_18450 [Terrabacter aeriphilus]|uniref:Flagellar protein n=1 Tax=Terrabacter aeriphilus TaxID=515662 RepID=A0ABP9JBW6_9MICO